VAHAAEFHRFCANTPLFQGGSGLLAAGMLAAMCSNKTISCMVMASSLSFVVFFILGNNNQLFVHQLPRLLFILGNISRYSCQPAESDHALLEAKAWVRYVTGGVWSWMAHWLIASVLCIKALSYSHFRLSNYSENINVASP
jgi:hypothetical protein